MPGNERTSGPNMCQSTLVNAILRILSAKGVRLLRAVLTVSVSDPNRALRGSPAGFLASPLSPRGHSAIAAGRLRSRSSGERVRRLRVRCTRCLASASRALPVSTRLQLAANQAISRSSRRVPDGSRDPDLQNYGRTAAGSPPISAGRVARIMRSQTVTGSGSGPSAGCWLD